MEFYKFDAESTNRSSLAPAAGRRRGEDRGGANYWCLLRPIGPQILLDSLSGRSYD